MLKIRGEIIQYYTVLYGLYMEKNQIIQYYTANCELYSETTGYIVGNLPAHEIASKRDFTLEFGIPSKQFQNFSRLRRARLSVSSVFHIIVFYVYFATQKAWNIKEGDGKSLMSQVDLITYAVIGRLPFL